MDFRNGPKRCLQEILDAVTPEDEASTLLILEYVKHYKGVILGPVSKDGYGNVFDSFPIVYRSPIGDETYCWNSFKEAKRMREKEKNSAQKIFHLKKGLKIAFKHEMVLSDYYDEGPHPKWVELYGQWFKQLGEYRMLFKTPEEKAAMYKFSQDLVKAGKEFLKKLED